MVLHLTTMLRSTVILLFSISAAAFCTAYFDCPPQNSARISDAAAARSPVLVELFTSEGCSDCPPADKLLADLDHDGSLDGIPVIALAEHVDYWDGQGWHDRFSSHAFTERQERVVSRLRLSSAYTPQMVVDGRLEFVGNDSNALHRVVNQAAQTPKTADVKLSWKDDGTLNVAVTDSTSHAATVLLAITESDLTTKVGGGENGGRELHHSAVVRRLAELGKLKDRNFASTTKIQRDSHWNPQRLKAVVFVQELHTGAVLGAQSIRFPG